MQTLTKAVQAFMRPIGPYPFHHIGDNYSEGNFNGPSGMVRMITDNDPFHWVHTMTLAQALDQIRVEAGLQRHADLFG